MVRKTIKQIKRAKEYQLNKAYYKKLAHRYYLKNRKHLLKQQALWKKNNPKRVKQHYETQEKRRRKLRKSPKWQRKQQEYRRRYIRKMKK